MTEKYKFFYEFHYIRKIQVQRNPAFLGTSEVELIIRRVTPQGLEPWTY